VLIVCGPGQLTGIAPVRRSEIHSFRAINSAHHGNNAIDLAGLELGKTG
jgi:hypothetical protein